jgi:phosphoglucosamine mutase
LKPKTPTKLFGTDGIRGKAGAFPLDSVTVRIIGASLAQHLAERTGNRAPTIIVGRDTRESGEQIEREMIAGARAEGAIIESAGVITTPGVAFLTGALSADAGLVISASHNPYQDNGIKIFDPSGRKLDNATEQKIEADIVDGRFAESIHFDEQARNERREQELRTLYLDYLQNKVAGNISLDGLTLVIDCANGAASQLAPELFTRLHARVIPINNQPNGRNINLNSGSLHIEDLQKHVIADRADLGVAFDGDADRALFVDADGNFVDGDATMWMLANYLNSRGQLDGNRVVSTVMTNLGLEIALRSRGIQLTRTDVGDKCVLDELLRSKTALGGEQSGHIIFPKISLAGDGMITAIKVLSVMCEDQKSLSQLAEGFSRYPQVLLNVRVREKLPFEKIPSVQAKVREIEVALGDRGRLLLRYSGTEPLARVMIEGEDEQKVGSLATELATIIRQEIGEPETVS